MASNPYNIKQVDYNGNNITIIDMDNIPDYDKEDYNLSDDKDRVKYFRDIENIIRGSFEYRQLINYMREFMDMNKCSFFENIDNIDSYNVKIHIHHTPLTLYELVVIIFEKRLNNREDIDPESVAQEVMYIHYCLTVGLIPLSETVHELVHNQYLFIPNSSVLGNYNGFIETYKPYISQEILSKLNTIEQCSETYDSIENTNILHTNYTYIDLSGTYKFPKMQDVLNQLGNRIESIRNNNFNYDDTNDSMITFTG